MPSFPRPVARGSVAGGAHPPRRRPGLSAASHTEGVQAILRTTDEPLGGTGCQGFAGDAVAGRPDRVADAAPAPAFP